MVGRGVMWRGGAPLGKGDRGSSLLILIHSFILFAQFQQLHKLTKPRFRQFPRIHYLPIRLQPVQHIMFLNPVPRRIPLILLDEPLHLIIPHQPTCFLIHLTSSLLHLTSIANVPPASYTYHHLQISSISDLIALVLTSFSNFEHKSSNPYVRSFLLHTFAIK